MTLNDTLQRFTQRITSSPRVIIGILGVCIVALLFGWLLNYFFTTGTLEYRLSNEVGNATVILRDESGTTTERVLDSQGVLSTRLKAGDYQITTTSGTSAHFSQFTISGALRTTSVSATINSAQTPRLLATNPKSCAITSPADTVVSWTCGGHLSTLSLHVAPTSSTAGYLQDFINYTDPATVEYVAFAGSNSVDVVVRRTSIQAAQHLRLRYDISGITPKLASSTVLQGLDSAVTYEGKKTNLGIVFYGSSLGSVKRTSSLDNPFTDLSLTDESSETIYSLSAPARTLVFSKVQAFETDNPYTLLSEPNNVISEAYIEDRDEGIHNHDAPEANETTEIIVSSEERTVTSTLPIAAHKIVQCGEATVCTLTGGELDVYSMGDFSLVDSINGVLQVIESETLLLFANASGVVNYDTSTRQGTYMHVFGGLAFCGIQHSDQGVTLCLQSKNTRFFSVLGPEKNTSGSDILAQLSGAVRSSIVSNVSVSDSILYFGLDIGSSQLLEDGVTYGYSEAQKAEAKDLLDDLIDQLGIDTNRYQIASITH